MGENLNFATTIALLGFVPIALVVTRRYRGPVAAAWLLVGAVLFLPMLAGFKLPGLPLFKKYQIAAAATFLGLALFHTALLRRVRVGPTPWVLMGLSLGGGALTALTNGDAQTFGPMYLPPLGPTEAIHYVLDAFLFVWVPFFIGAACFRRYEGFRTLMQVVAMAALVYVIPIAIELRLSPQMHNWVYGYAQHEFAQTIRGGGYRPMVFMNHGLSVALFISASLVMTAALAKTRERVVTWRWRRRVRLPRGWTELGVLSVVLVLVKSMGALVFGLFSVPLVLLTKPAFQHLVAALLAVGFIAYPFARSSGAIPDEEIVQFATDQFGEERAASLDFRLTNERALIERSNERMLLGWGGHCRACIYDIWTGDLISVRDGAWIISLGDTGIVGFIGRFGVIVYAIFFALRRRRRIRDKKAQRLYAAMAVVTSLYLVDCLPNGMYNYFPLVFAGALVGGGYGLTGPTKSQQRASRRKQRRTERMAQRPPAPARW